MITAPDLVSKFIELEHAKRKFEEQIDDLKQQQNQLEHEIVEQWLELGTKHVKTDRGTLTLHNKFVCNKRGGFTRDAACDALRAAGLGELVRNDYAPSSVKARIKEDLEDGGEIDDGLAAVFDWKHLPQLVLTAG